MNTDRDSLITLARSGSWPVAAGPGQVVTDRDEAKTARARDVLDHLVCLRPDSRFLDYGCGEGHTVALASSLCEESSGYDPVWQSWNKFGNQRLTVTINEVARHHHYTDILLYDVLDHLSIREQVPLLRQLREWLAPGGSIHVRCHPYIAIHGTHLYATLNLAYAHLVFTEDDIRKLGGRPQRVCKVVRPLSTYAKWFADAGLHVVREEVVRSAVPHLFADQDLINHIAANVFKAGLAGGAKVTSKEVIHSLMSVQFVDYRLMAEGGTIPLSIDQEF